MMTFDEVKAKDMKKQLNFYVKYDPIFRVYKKKDALIIKYQYIIMY